MSDQVHVTLRSGGWLDLRAHLLTVQDFMVSDQIVGTFDACHHASTCDKSPDLHHLVILRPAAIDAVEER